MSELSLVEVTAQIPAIMNSLGTALFAIALVHIFCAKQVARVGTRFPPGSLVGNIFHFLGEVEIVFGLWAGVLMVFWILLFGVPSSIAYVESVNFTESAFVFVIMCMAATLPILGLAKQFITQVARLIPVPHATAMYFCTMSLGPLLGSFITEPAAMTVVALLLRQLFFSQAMSTNFRYTTVGLLFVNVSVGGTLTHFAAPPVLMVSATWGWDSAFMFSHFGLRAGLAVCLGSLATAAAFRKELREMKIEALAPRVVIPFWVTAVHALFMFTVVYFNHHMKIFIPIFLFFLGWCTVAKEYQDELKIRESLLVGLFLAGLVTLGGLQGWWLKDLLSGFSEMEMLFGATALTAITDNAALTYLGTLVPNLSDALKFALVAGAVSGGGLTVIANAPNPVGYGILSPIFGEKGISALGLLLGALPFTLLVLAIFIAFPP